MTAACSVLLNGQPEYLNWWNDLGPDKGKELEVYLRTAISVEKEGWAHFDFVRMPEYRWGIFLAPAEENRKIGFGQHLGEDAWQEVPGEYRGELRRLIVTQGDTEPASCVLWTRWSRRGRRDAGTALRRSG